MRNVGFMGLAATLAVFPVTAATAVDSTADQRRWGDVPQAELRVPDRMGPQDRVEGGYRDDRGPPPRPEYGADYSYDDATGGIEGTWEGTWRGEYDDGRPYEYSGSFDGEYRPAGAPYAMPGHDGPPHGPGPHHGPHPAIVRHGSQAIINGVAYPAGGTVANGYYYPPATTTTVTVHQRCCPHAEPAAAWKPRPKKTWKTKPKSKIIRMTK